MNLKHTVRMFCATVATLAAITMSVEAGDQCYNADAVRAEAQKLNIAPSNIATVTDKGFIVDYLNALGLGVPLGSTAAGLILVGVGGKVYVGVIEDNGCILHQAGVPLAKHIEALKTAAAGV